MKIFITGSSDGLGSLAAKELLAQGHDVVLHARNGQRAQAALVKNPQASQVLIADLADPEQVKQLAQQANQLGSFDALIHNAGVYTSDRELTFKINVLAPYILTALMNKPKRLVYVSSSMHKGSRLNRADLTQVDYSASKLEILLLMRAVQKVYPDLIVNSLDPGWVSTKMGGPGANDDLYEGYASHVLLATQDLGTGGYYYHRQRASYDKRVDDSSLLADFIKTMEQVSGLKL